MNKYSATFLVFISLLTGPQAFANADKNQQKSAQYIDGKRVQKPVEAFEKTRNKLTDGLFKLSNRIDYFFSREYNDSEKNNSQMNVGLNVTVENNEKPEYAILLNTYLRLPMTEEKFQLFLTNLKNEEENNTDNTNSLGAGLRFEHFKRKNTSFQTDGGLRITDRLDPFIKFRLRNSFDYTLWTSRFVQTLYWFDSVGYEFLTEMFWDKKINAILLYRIYTSAQWTELEKTINFKHNYNVIHTFDKHQALIYTLGLEGINKPAPHVENYKVTVALKTLIYKDWLFLGLAPGAVWRKEDGFQTRAQFMFNLDVLIGDTDS